MVAGNTQISWSTWDGAFFESVIWTSPLSIPRRVLGDTLDFRLGRLSLAHFPAAAILHTGYPGFPRSNSLLPMIRKFTLKSRSHTHSMAAAEKATPSNGNLVCLLTAGVLFSDDARKLQRRRIPKTGAFELCHIIAVGAVCNQAALSYGRQ